MTTKTPGQSDHAEPAFPVTANNLQDRLAYTTHSSGRGLHSLVSLPAGSLFSPITAYTLTPTPKWHTLQISRSGHISLDSAFKYLNHSCAPTLEIDTEKLEVRVARDRDLKEGDELNFFYPSTEWEMDRGFECLCGAGDRCIREVKGAKEMSVEELGGWFVNPYIYELKKGE